MESWYRNAKHGDRPVQTKGSLAVMPEDPKPEEDQPGAEQEPE